MGKEIIRKLFKQANVALSDTELSKFEHLYERYTQYNEEWDLSRLTTDNDIVIKHFIDSVLPARLVQLPASLLDIGTGPGFPGIPIKIVSPETKIILAEPRFRRVNFMKMMIEELELHDASVYPHLVTEESNFEVEGVVTRAFEAASGTLERVKHFIPKGGKVILLKGPGAEEDLKNLTEANKRDYELTDDISYTLPIIGHDRRILVFTKLTDFKRITYRILMNDRTDFGIPVSSAENKRYKEIKKSVEKGPKKSGITLIAGKKLIIEFLNKNNFAQNLILPDEYTESDPEFLDIVAKFHEQNKLLIMKKSLFQEIESAYIPVLAADTPEIAPWSGAHLDGCTVVIPFQDPANVGAAVRSAAAFGIKNVLLLKEAANPFNQKSVRSSAGTVFAVNFLAGPSYEEIADICESSSIPLVTLDKCGTPVRTFSFPKSFFFLTGIEGQGLTEELKKFAVSIPIESDVESLNAYAALSIALYEYKMNLA